MAKKKQQRQPYGQATQKPADDALEVKTGHSFKEMLGDDALSKLKALEKEMKAEKERAAEAEAERRRREQEEREKNKSFGELLEEYDKRGGGKYS